MLPARPTLRLAGSIPPHLFLMAVSPAQAELDRCLSPTTIDK